MADFPTLGNPQMQSFILSSVTIFLLMSCIHSWYICKHTTYYELLINNYVNITSNLSVGQ